MSTPQSVTQNATPVLHSIHRQPLYNTQDGLSPNNSDRPYTRMHRAVYTVEVCSLHLPCRPPAQGLAKVLLPSTHVPPNALLHLAIRHMGTHGCTASTNTSYLPTTLNAMPAC